VAAGSKKYESPAMVVNPLTIGPDSMLPMRCAVNDHRFFFPGIPVVTWRRQEVPRQSWSAILLLPTDGAFFANRSQAQSLAS